MKFRAVIWDMDGVIADTALKHFQAWQRMFGKRGIEFTESEFRKNFGERNDMIIRRILSDSVSPGEIDAIAQEKEADYRRHVGPDLRALPGARALLAALKERGFKQAVASSGPRDNVDLVIRTLGVDRHFEAVVAGRDVSESKPSPQIFLLAADKLGVPPACCLVIEDAVSGIAAAKAAGMRCVAVATTHPRERLMEADLVVDSLEPLTVAHIERLLDSCVDQL